MGRNMKDGRYIAKFYSIPDFWMVVLAVYDSDDSVHCFVERHVVWNEDTSQDRSFLETLPLVRIPKDNSKKQTVLIDVARSAVEIMKVRWNKKFFPGEKEDIKFFENDLDEDPSPDIRWEILSYGRFFKNALKQVAERTCCTQLKESLCDILSSDRMP